VSVRDRLTTGGVGGPDQVSTGLSPALHFPARRQHLAVRGEDGAATHLRRDLLQVFDRPTGIGEGRDIDGGHYAKIASVTLQQGSWLTVVIVCGISVILLAVGGYTGYSIVVGAVGLAAAVNLT
jgi:hypothetical protein